MKAVFDAMISGSSDEIRVRPGSGKATKSTEFGFPLLSGLQWFLEASKHQVHRRDFANEQTCQTLSRELPNK